MIPLFFLLGLIACRRDDDAAPQIWEVNMNGEEFTVVDFDVGLVEDNQSSARTSTNLLINGEIDGGTLSINLLNWDFQNPPTDGILVKEYTINATGPGLNAQCLSDILGVNDYE